MRMQGMNDKTKWENAHFEHDAHPVDGPMSKAAAAEEAVARHTMATCPRDGTVILLHWGEDHVSPGWWDAAVAPVQNEDGTWPSDTGGFPWAFFDLRDGTALVNHAVDTEYGPTHWSIYAAPVAAAPVDGWDAQAYRQMAGELESWKQRALTAEGDFNRLHNAMNAEDGPTHMGEPVLSTPAAPGIDLEQFREAVAHWKRDLHDDYKGGHIHDGGEAMRKADRLLRLIDDSQNGGKCCTCEGHGMIGGLLPAGGGYESEPCPDCSPKGVINPEWSLHDRVEFALRDAGFDLDEAAFVAEAASVANGDLDSPKGGSTSDCPIIRLAPGEYTDWEKRVWRRGVIECATQPDIAAAMQATSAEVGS